MIFVFYLNEMKAESGLGINKELSKIFGEMADFYAYLGPKERFRRRAYDNASKLMSIMKEPIVAAMKNNTKIGGLHGIGHSIAAKIQEYAKSGKISTHQQLKKMLPYDLIQLMHTQGIGPSIIHNVETAFHVKNRKELIEVLNSDPKLPKGIGEKKMALLRDALLIHEKNKVKRFTISEIIPVSERILSFISHIPHVEKAVIAGSIRRRKETIGDIDIIACCSPKYASVISDRLVMYTSVKRVLSKGNTKISLRLIEKDIQCDIRLVSPDSYGAALLYFTGSKEHNIQLRTIAKQRGLKINEYGVFDTTGNKIAGKTETEVYSSLGLSFILPENRMGGEEIKEAKIPDGKSDMVW